jgi:hypothetical protein
VAQTVEHLPSKCKVLSSNHSDSEKKLKLRFLMEIWIIHGRFSVGRS